MLAAALLQRTSDINACSIKTDEEFMFFPTIGHFDIQQKVWKIPIHGWIYEPENDSLTVKSLGNTFGQLIHLTKDEISSQPFQKRSRLFFADNERNKKISVRIWGEIYSLKPSKPNGHIEDEIIIPVISLHQQHDPNATESIPIETVCDQGHRIFSGKVHVVGSQGISVISDIDDTIKISSVTDRKALIRNTFVREFVDVPGMARLYDNLHRTGAAFHYVSASPWQLYPWLMQFLVDSGFPFGAMHLKHFRWKDSSFFSLFENPVKYKLDIIETIFSQFPDRQFILIGDSGEMDPEIYGKLAVQHPAQVQKILIRNTQPNDTALHRFEKAFSGIPQDKWLSFNSADEINPLGLTR